MKVLGLNRRVEGLIEKLKDPTVGSLVHLDFDSFSEPEKILFRRVDKIEEKYRQTGSLELLAEDVDLISKSLEVFLRRVRELFCCAVPGVLGGDGADEVVEYFFRLHFSNFEADLTECLAQVCSWSEKDREDFLLHLKKNGEVLFRVPRGSNDDELCDLNDSKDLEEYVEEKEEFGLCDREENNN